MPSYEGTHLPIDSSKNVDSWQNSLPAAEELPLLPEPSGPIQEPE